MTSCNKIFLSASAQDRTIESRDTREGSGPVPYTILGTRSHYRSCNEVRQAKKLEGKPYLDGQYMLDVDGIGPIAPRNFYCDFTSDDARNVAWTLVEYGTSDGNTDLRTSNAVGDSVDLNKDTKCSREEAYLLWRQGKQFIKFGSHANDEYLFAHAVTDNCVKSGCGSLSDENVGAGQGNTHYGRLITTSLMVDADGLATDPGSGFDQTGRFGWSSASGNLPSGCTKHNGQSSNGCTENTINIKSSTNSNAVNIENFATNDGDDQSYAVWIS